MIHESTIQINLTGLLLRLYVYSCFLLKYTEIVLLYFCGCMHKTNICQTKLTFFLLATFFCLHRLYFSYLILLFARLAGHDVHTLTIQEKL